ncbi:AAA family ATPase [Methanofollis tationis]|uniref:AAA family ATPase n=1 Tax=Methanofollis tationis TaxID=81417 RepID=A0A7K4HNM7_9EURY|nr:AAA family ATPase [Methanofollis tationis]NVO66438.1 AAA family ATPase [Methanofollis tationis]
MKISSLYIDGFGKFQNWKPSTSFGDGLTAIVGSNEAGKTTLLTFIRRMLYGFPDGRKKDLNHYTPINGGTIGGRLEIQGEDGREYILSRTGIRGSPSLTYADGTTARGSTLSSLLGPCDQIFYENVCAIGLGELQEISTLRRDEIRDRLAAAGAGNLPVRDVATSLQTSADEIYAVRGKKKRINALVSDLKEVEANISTVKKNQREYDQINEEINRMRGAVAEEERKQKTVEEEITYFKALGQAWEAFTEREDARNILSTIPETEPFPGDALEKINQAENEVRRLETEYDDLTKEHTGLKEEIGHCVVRGEVVDQADTIHALEPKTEWYRSQMADLNTISKNNQGIFYPQFTAKTRFLFSASPRGHVFKTGVFR